jgi:hypothetical protein
MVESSGSSVIAVNSVTGAVSELVPTPDELKGKCIQKVYKERVKVWKTASIEDLKYYAVLQERTSLTTAISSIVQMARSKLVTMHYTRRQPRSERDPKRRKKKRTKMARSPST